MSVFQASRRKRLLYAVVALASTRLGLALPAAARGFPEVNRSTVAVSPVTAAVDAPLVSLSAPELVGVGAPISASATALTTVSSISIGYCPGFTCSAPFATEFASAPGGLLNMSWTGLPPDGVYTLVASAVTVGGGRGESTAFTVTVDGTAPETTLLSAPSATVAVASA